MGELRWSLQEVEHSWMECKEDCIRFTERINTAEREVHTSVCFLSAVSFLYSFVYLSSCPYLALPVARVTETAGSLIDVILTSKNSLINQDNVLKTTISDHFGIL